MSFIHRQHPTTDESPPWDGIAFRLPIDSDLLAESLKSKYPHHRTLRQRKYQATIDFFLGELSQMQSRDSISVPMLRSGGLLLNDQPIPTSATFIPAVSDQSRPQSASECTSPSIKGSSTSPQSLEFLNPGSSLASNTNLQPPTTTSSSSHFVWNAHDGRAARPKTKRKMTVEERSAYKETRKRGACSRCRKQKGKCTHMIDGDPQPTENETFKSAKRRISGEIEQDTSDGLKTVKTEHASDVHHLTMTQPLEHESSTVMQTSANVDESVAQLAIQPSPKQWEREPQIEASAEVYVPTDFLPDLLIGSYGVQPQPEPWQSYPSFPGYVSPSVIRNPEEPFPDLRSNPAFHRGIGLPQHTVPSGYTNDGPWMENMETPDED